MRIFQTATHKLMNKKQFQSIYREVRIGFFPFTNYHASCFSELENKVNELEIKVNTVYHKNALLEAEIMMIKNKIGM